MPQKWLYHWVVSHSVLQNEMCHQLQEFQDLKGSSGMNGEGWGWLVIWFAVVRAILLGRNNMSFGQKNNSD